MFDNKFLAICDCGINANSGEWEVQNQRDWNVPEFDDLALKTLCKTTDCDETCDKCVVTRLKEAIYEDQY